MEPSLATGIGVVALGVIVVPLSVHFTKEKQLEDDDTDRSGDVADYYMDFVSTKPPETETNYDEKRHVAGDVVSVWNGKRFCVMNRATKRVLWTGKVPDCVAVVGNTSQALVGTKNGRVHRFDKNGITVTGPPHRGTVVAMTATEDMDHVFIQYSSCITHNDNVFYEYDQGIKMEHLDDEKRLVIRDKTLYYRYAQRI